MKKVAIAGGGPTGVTLALMLLQRGISVTLVEAASDFHRVFRGEGLMPSGLDALNQMGLSKILEQIPHRPLDGWEFILDKKSLFRVEEPMETDAQPCTLVDQPPLLEALILEAQKYNNFEFIQGVAVKDLLWINNRVAGMKLANGREIPAEVVIGADGRNSIIRQRAGLKLERQPKSMDVLWFKLAASPRFVDENVFYAIGDGENAFAVFHGASPGKLHLAWTLSGDNQNENIDRSNTEWGKVFASLSPSWLAQHFLDNAETIEKPIKLSVVVGLCPSWFAPGVILLGDAAHPMSPIRAQGINVALRDVIAATNYLVPVLLAEELENKPIDEALSQIQKEREPEIIRIQQLQEEEGRQQKLFPKNKFLLQLFFRLIRLLSKGIRQSWIRRQRKMRCGVTRVKLGV